MLVAMQRMLAAGRWRSRRIELAWMAIRSLVTEYVNLNFLDAGDLGNFRSAGDGFHLELEGSERVS